MGAGHYLALKAGSSENVEGVTYTFTITDSDGSRSVTLDNDQNIVVQIKSTDQVISFKAEKEGYGTDVTTLKLTGLTLEEAPEEEAET